MDLQQEHLGLAVNPNYKEINVEEQLNDENSILNFYKKMITLRKENDVLNLWYL